MSHKNTFYWNNKCYKLKQKVQKSKHQFHQSYVRYVGGIFHILWTIKKDGTTFDDVIKLKKFQMENLSEIRKETTPPNPNKLNQE